MNWTAYLHQNHIFLLLLIVALGFAFGRLKVGGFSFGSSGILFVAMMFGHFGFSLSSEFQRLGLILFVYAVGLQAGPAILSLNKQQGRQLNFLVLVLLGIGALVTLGLAKVFHLDMDMAVGLFAGAMTSTPGLAAAQETTQSALTSTGYGIGYPVGVIGVILFLKFMPVLFRGDIHQEEQAEAARQAEQSEPVISDLVEVTNSSLQDKSLAELHFARATCTIVSRLMRAGEILVPRADTRLQLGDVVRLVGTKANIDVAASFLGRITDQKFPETHKFESRKFVITNKDIVGKTVAEVNLHGLFNANITRIRRGGVEFTAEPHQQLCWGDRLRIAGEASQLDAIRDLLGDELKKLKYGDIFSVILGMLLGMTIGLIPFSIGQTFSLKLGLAGGVLLAGLFLGNRVKFGPLIWHVPMPVISFMREFGLILFLAVVGINAGSQVVAIVRDDGVRLILAGAGITLIPMFTVAWIARRKYQLGLIELVGIISGGMTSTPGLATSASMTSSQTPLILYATVYPLAMVLMMVLVKILAFF